MADQPRLVVRLDDLASGSMTGIDADGTCIVLIRRGETVIALDGTCPHAGAPLAEGILTEDRIICPWHKAAFCARTGTCLEPPAVDDLRRFPTEIWDGSVFVTLDPPPRATEARSTPDGRSFIVIGSGAAGTAAAQTLRAEGFSGRLQMIDREDALPYDRTILSKYVLSGQEAGEKTPLHSDEFYRRNAIERLDGVVTELRPAERRIVLSDGRSLSYDAALIATGGIPAPAPFPRTGLANVFLLRSQADAARIVAAAGHARRAVIVGSGFIGMEAAGSLRERGLEVTVVTEEAHPFDKPLGRQIGTALQHLHEEKGVQFRLQRKVARLEGDRAVARVVLTDGQAIAADLVLIGLGIRPATSFVKDLGLREDGGVAVDARLCVTAGLYAGGDIAAFPLQGDGPPIRVEHWRVAEQHGRAAARNMLGADRAYDAVPYFWTIHYRQRLDYVGHGSGQDDIQIRGDLAKREFIAYFLRDRRVCAAAGMGRDRDMAAVLALMARRRGWTLDELHPAGSSPCTVLSG